jgi:DNA polymerase-1
MNAPIQGTSADIIKIAMVRLDEELHNRKLKTSMLVQVHDELLFEVPDGEMDVVVPLVRTAMESAMQLSVPLVVDVKTGRDWATMKKIS